MMKRTLTCSLLIFVSLLLMTTTAVAQNLGRATIAGVVRDDSGDVIPGVTVTATRGGDSGSGVVEVTDERGAFRLQNLQPGTWTIEALLDGFQQTSRSVTLVTSQSIEVAFRLVPAFTETVDVVASAIPAGEVAILETRRQSAVVSDSISSEEIRKTPDSSAAGVVERLTGVTVIGDKYVFVRGLGERYSGTTINGATVPTTETEKRVVPLDLFPARLLETVNVVKTYTPDKPGDFGSGIVEMTTTDFPGASTYKLTLGAGYQSGATGQSFRRYAGGLGRLGNGGQSLPAAVPADFLKRRSALDPSGYSPAELQEIGRSFVGSWTGQTIDSASPATNYALTWGATLGRLGIVFSATSNHGYDVTREEQRFFGLDSGGTLVPRNDYEMWTDKEKINAGLVGNLSFRLTDSNRIYLSSVMTRDGAAEDRVQEGLNMNTGGYIRDLRARYQLEEVLSNRLRGEHNLGGPWLGSLIEWSVAQSRATNDSNIRENLYRESSPGVFALQVGFPESGKMEFFSLEDEISQASTSWMLFHAGESGWSGSLKGGIDHLQRTRDFTTRRFRFTTANQLQFDLTLHPDELFTPENIRPNGFEIREITGVNDAYDAEHTINAGYVMADATFGRVRLIGGARYEDSDQQVNTFNPFDPVSASASINQSRDLLPSFNVVYGLADRTNLRFAYGRSLNRPEFRELSPFTFVEVTGGRSVAGNPELTQATLDGYDLRWETFPAGGGVIAASLFYKSIDSPIERIIQPTTELRTSFVNADAATLWGAELELRRSLAVFLPRLANWSVNANYSYINSDVRVGERQLSVVTSTERPLEGQSDQMGNLAIQYLRQEWGSMFRLLGSYSGKRLTDVGAFGLPDIYESGTIGLDFVYSQSLGALLDGLDVKLAANNILDSAREFTQGGLLQRRYEPGRSISLSLSIGR